MRVCTPWTAWTPPLTWLSWMLLPPHSSPLRVHPCCFCLQARRSALYCSPQGHLFQQLLDLLAFYCDFPMDDHSGEQMKEDDVTARHYDKVRGGVFVCFGMEGLGG